MIVRIISHYRIDDKLGSYGMSWFTSPKASSLAGLLH
jgi:hypothetical protein